MTEIGYYRYEGFDLRTKFGWISGAAGLQATEPARIGMGNLGNAFVASDDAIRGLLAPLGLQWQGHAAEAAAGALAQAADRAGTAGVDGGAGSSAVAGYGQSFEELRPKIAWQDPGSWDWWDVGIDVYGAGMRTAFGDTFDVQSDFTATLEENRTLDARANEALYSHEQVSRQRLDAFPLVEPASAPAVSGGPTGSGGMDGYATATPFPSPGPVGADPVGIGPAGGASAPPGAAAASGSPTPGRFAPETIGAGSIAGPPPVTGAQVPGPVPGFAPAGGAPAPGSSGGLSRPGSASAGRGRSTGISGRRPAWGGGARGEGLPVGIGRGGIGTNGLPGGTGRSVPAGGQGVGLGRGGTNGGEFAGRLPGGSEQSSAARPGAGAGGAPGSARTNAAGSSSHPPFLGGMGAGTGAGPTEHKVRYWIPSTEAFDVDLPPHTEPVIEGRDG